MAATAHRFEAPEENEFAPRILASAKTIFEYVTIALALSRDRNAVRTIRARANLSKRRAFLGYSTQGPWIHLSGDAVTGYSLEPPRPSDGPTVDLKALFASDPSTFSAVADAYQRAGILPEVAGWFRAFGSGGDELTRETFQAIASFQPLIAVEAFRQLTHASMALDVERPKLLRAVRSGEPSPDALSAYWTLIHMVGNDAILATMGEETAWLAEMAAVVPAGRWTPSFTLVRERLLRLGLRGGWAAAGFGESVVSRYLKVLQPGVAPLLAFDAVLGLTAIAARHTELTLPVRRELQGALDFAGAASSPEHRALLEAMGRSAELALTNRARVNFDALDGDADCAAIEDGLFPCIVAVPSVVTSPAEALFRPASEPLPNRDAPVYDRAREVLLRTGTASAHRIEDPSPRERLN